MAAISEDEEDLLKTEEDEGEEEGEEDNEFELFEETTQSFEFNWNIQKCFRFVDERICVHISLS